MVQKPWIQKLGAVGLRSICEGIPDAMYELPSQKVKTLSYAWIRQTQIQQHQTEYAQK